MLLSANFLSDVGSVNTFSYVNDISFTQGDGVSIYLQIIDASVNRASENWNPAGRRYMPAAGSTLQVTFKNLDASKVITRYASQPYSLDGSIWVVNVLPSDPISAGTLEMGLILNESGSVKYGKVCSPIRVQGVC